MFSQRGGGASRRLNLTGDAVLVFRASTFLKAARAAEPFRYAADATPLAA